MRQRGLYSFFFFNDTATTEIYTLSLHDALPISFSCKRCMPMRASELPEEWRDVSLLLPVTWCPLDRPADRKSTRLNSSHLVISYAVFCLKKKKDWRIP